MISSNGNIFRVTGPLWGESPVDWPHKGQWPAMEVSKSSSPFSSTNIIASIVWLLQLHDTIQMKSNYTWINYNNDNIAIRSHIMTYVWNLIFGTNLVAFISQKEKNVCFLHHLLTCSVRKMVLICLRQNIDICLLYKSYQIPRLVSHLINNSSKWMFTV